MRKIIVESKAYGSKSILVDDEDYNAVSIHKWTITRIGHTFYAHRPIPGPKGKKKYTYLHRFLLDHPEKGLDVDHEDGNGLNNQRSNLRTCTHAENIRKKRKQKNNTSGYVGVSLDKRNGRFHAYIKLNGKRTFIGYYKHAIDAAAAYNRKAVELHGEFAHINPL
jgi:hypothetical protein